MPGGSLTGWWYTGMSHGLGVHFHHFGYLNGWVSVTAPMRPIFKIGCIWENVAKKAPNLPKIGCFLRKIGIVMGRDLTLSRYLYGQNRETCVAHPRQTWIREPPLRVTMISMFTRLLTMIKLDDEDDDLLLPEPDFQDMHEDVALFCVCKVPLTGDMLPCPGGACEGKWFHYNCVGISNDNIPQGVWYCNQCWPVSRPIAISMIRFRNKRCVTTKK